MEDNGKPGFVWLYEEKYVEVGLCPESVAALICFAIFPGNLRGITDEQIRAIPGFKAEDLTRLNQLRENRSD